MLETLKQTVTIVNKRGLHARASSKLAKLAATFPAAGLTVQKGDMIVPAASVMGLLTLGAGLGTDVIVAANGVGPQAGVGLEALVGLIASGFDEDDCCIDQNCSHKKIFTPDNLE